MKSATRLWLRATLLPLALLGASAAQADDKEESLPIGQLTAAIQAAVTSQPGQVMEVDVDRKRGQLVVEVQIAGNDGRKHEVRVDPQTNSVVPRR